MAISDLELALRLADLADELTLATFGRASTWSRKADGSPVCEADLSVEARLHRELREVRPSDAIVSEEAARANRDDAAGRVWLIDPIDQTRNFLRGNPEFATMIALKDAGRNELGVVSAPALRHRWWARRGAGAWKDSKRMRVSTVSALDDAYVSIAGHREWHQMWHWPAVAELLERCAYPVGSAGGFLPVMLVADGALDVFAESWGASWDHAAPGVILEESGGCVSDLDGGPAAGGSLLATNGLLHGLVLPYFQRVRDT